MTGILIAVSDPNWPNPNAKGAFSPIVTHAYLFRQDGEGVALCISHGSTRFDGGDFKPRTGSSIADAVGTYTDWPASGHAIGPVEVGAIQGTI